MITKLVSDISSTEASRTPPPGAADGVPNWRRTGSLDALQELVAIAEVVPAVVARRAVAPVTELAAARTPYVGELAHA